MMNHTIKATSLINKTKVKTGNKNETRNLPYARTKTTTKPFFSNAHPLFLDRDSRRLPLRDGRKAKAVVYALKKGPALPLFFQARLLSPLPNFSSSKLPVAKGKQNCSLSFFFFAEFFSTLFFVSSCPFYRVKR